MSLHQQAENSALQIDYGHKGTEDRNAQPGDAAPHTVVTTETSPSWSPAVTAIVSPKCKPSPAFIHIISSLSTH